MGIATQTRPASPALLTWEAYLTEGEVAGRYDILEGTRIFMPAPTWKHQRIQYRVSRILGDYEDRTGNAIYAGAPFDVLIYRTPRLKTRQPDALLIRPATFARSLGYPNVGVLTVAPELIVEVISDNEGAQDLEDKLTDYASIGVAEAWVLRPDEQTAEVLQRVGTTFVSVCVYKSAETLQSLVFPDLSAPVADFYKP